MSTNAQNGRSYRSSAQRARRVLGLKLAKSVLQYRLVCAIAEQCVVRYLFCAASSTVNAGYRYNPLGYVEGDTHHMADNIKKRALQAHGLNSKVYGPILLHIFNSRWRQGTPTVLFTLDDVRNSADALKLEVRNPADLIYRMRSRTILPKEILDKGFYILRAIGRGQYQFEKGSSTLFEPLNSELTEALDLTPLPVRRLLPERLADMDEQAVLTIASYCKLFDHFTGLQVYRLRSHVRKSVPGIGQAELDAIDVGVALRDDEMPVVFPIEAKGAIAKSW